MAGIGISAFNSFGKKPRYVSSFSVSKTINAALASRRNPTAPPAPPHHKYVSSFSVQKTISTAMAQRRAAEAAPHTANVASKNSGWIAGPAFYTPDAAMQAAGIKNTIVTSPLIKQSGGQWQGGVVIGVSSNESRFQKITPIDNPNRLTIGQLQGISYQLSKGIPQDQIVLPFSTAGEEPTLSRQSLQEQGFQIVKPTDKGGVLNPPSLGNANELVPDFSGGGGGGLLDNLSSGGFQITPMVAIFGIALAYLATRGHKKK